MNIHRRGQFVTSGSQSGSPRPEACGTGLPDLLTRVPRAATRGPRPVARLCPEFLFTAPALSQGPRRPQSFRYVGPVLPDPPADIVRDQLAWSVAASRAGVKLVTVARLMRLLSVVLVCSVSCTGSPSESASGDAKTQAIAGFTQIQRMTPGPWTEYRTKGALNRDARFFVAHDDRPKPLVVLLRGSGCTPLFVIDDDGASSDTSIFQGIVGPRSERFHFIMVESPGVEPLRFPAGMSPQEKKQAFAASASDCSSLYRSNQTKDARVDDVMAVLSALAGQPWIRDVLLVGHSEGSQVATGIIQRPKATVVSAAALLSSAGPTQLFGFHVARGGTRDSFVRTFEDMRMLQQDADDVTYLGEPARRWKSYALGSTPVEDVRDSDVPLYVAHGGRENNLLAADLFVLEALRQQPRRSLRYVVVDNADHAFVTADGQSRIVDLFDDFVDWALDVKRTTDVKLLR